MTAPLAVQLYSVREALARDYEGVVRQIADMGYAGVETAGFPGTTPQAAAQLFQDLGLQVAAAHSPLPIGERQNELLDAVLGVGATRLVNGGIDRNLYSNADGIAIAADMFNEAAAIAAAHGLSLGIHTHWWEFGPVEGKLAFDVLRARLDPAIFFEIDTYWAQTAGVDPIPVLTELGPRAPLVHIKDGPTALGEPHVAVGAGKMDIPAVVAATLPYAEWLIVELDQCATDMLRAVGDSYAYMVGHGLAHGRK